LGSRFPYAKVIRFPINVSCQIEAIASDIAASSLASVICNDVNYNLTINMSLPCSGASALAATYTLIGAKIDSQNNSASVGPNNTVTATYLAPLGGPSDVTHNLFLSGILT